jgi:hypothetical protein
MSNLLCVHNEIKVLKARILGLETEKRMAIKKIMKEFSELPYFDRYEHLISIKRIGPIYGFKIVRVLKKNRIIDGFEHLFRSGICSVLYYRTSENILTYKNSHGHKLLITEPFICSDELYKEFLSGVFEEKYINRRFLNENFSS